MDKKTITVFSISGLLIVLSIAYLYVPSETSVLFSPDERDFTFANYLLIGAGILLGIIFIVFVGMLGYSVITRRKNTRAFR